MDYKIEIVIRDVTRGDIGELVKYIKDAGPDFDDDRGDFAVTITRRESADRQWFYSDEGEDD